MNGENPAQPRAINPWIVALAVVIPTFMEVLDTTIANVALRYMEGGLSAPVTDSEWVITSYLAANAIILPISGWLALRLGRRNYFLLSIADTSFCPRLFRLLCRLRRRFGRSRSPRIPDETLRCRKGRARRSRVGNEKAAP